MASDFRGASLFSDIRLGREGAQLEACFRLLLAMLHEWSCFQKAHGKADELGVGGLDAIAFDKFANFIFGIWTHLFKQSRDNVLDSVAGSVAPTINVVRFPAPFQSYPGKHGPGPGRIDNSTHRVQYVIDILFGLQREGILNYFDIIPPQDHPDKPKNPNSMIYPGMPLSVTSLTDLSEFELNVARDLAGALKRLSPQQIRALGTHQSLSSTIAAIEKEFRDLRAACRGVIAGLDHDSIPFEESLEFLEFADEARRKAFSNRAAYEEAFAGMLGELSYEPLRIAFVAVQARGEEIWDGASMSQYAERARRVCALAECTHALAYFADHASERLSRTPRGRKYWEMWDRGVASLAQLNVAKFPLSPAGVFLGNGQELQAEFRHRLSSLLAPFALDTPSSDASGAPSVDRH